MRRQDNDSGAQYAPGLTETIIEFGPKPVTHCYRIRTIFESATGQHGLSAYSAEACATTAGGSEQARVGIGVADAYAHESRDDSIEFPVMLTRPVDTKVLANYQARDVTAKAGEDYVSTPIGTLTFAPGETLKTVSVPLINDLIEDPYEIFTLRLLDRVFCPDTGNVCVDLCHAVATGTIYNSENAAPSSIAVADAAADEAGTLELVVALDPAASGTVTVDQAMRAVSDRLTEPGASTELRLGGLESYRPVSEAEMTAGRTGFATDLTGRTGPGNASGGHAMGAGPSGTASDMGMGASAHIGAQGSGFSASATPFGGPMGQHPGMAPAMGPGAAGVDPSMAPLHGGGQRMHLPDLAMLLSGASFRWSPEGAARSRFTTWGRGSETRFDGHDETVPLRGVRKHGDRRQRARHGVPLPVARQHAAGGAPAARGGADRDGTRRAGRTARTCPNQMRGVALRL